MTATKFLSDGELQQLANHIIEFSKRNGGNGRYLVGVSGIAGSGKTTISNKLVALINEASRKNVSICLPMDGFHLTKAQLNELPDPALSHKRRGAYWTFDGSGFVAFVKSLTIIEDNKPIFAPKFDHGIGDPERNAIEILPSHKIVVIEGLYTCIDKVHPWSELLPIYDCKVLIKPKSVSVTRHRLATRHLNSNLADTYEGAVSRIENNDDLNSIFISENIDTVVFDYVIEN